MTLILRLALHCAAVLFLPLAIQAGQRDGTLDFYWIDSEGGGSTLVVTPNGESILMDAGHLGARDAGWILDGIKAAGLTRLDHLVITHYHSDHFGAAAEIAKSIPIGIIHQRAIPDHDPDGRPASTFPLQIKPYRELTAPRSALAAGTIIPLRPPGGAAAPRLELRCLGADQKFVEPTAAQTKQPNPLSGTGVAKPVKPSDDDNSAVFVLEYGPFRFFNGGDITWNLEEKLVAPYNLIGKVDVYQTNHHGLDSSNNPLFVQSLAPEVVVMNNGPRKGGQPGSFAALHGTKSIRALYQVHKSLNVPAAENAPDDFIANLAEGQPVETCTAHFIKLSVAPDGRSYTVTIPANGHSRTYQTVAK